MDKSKHYTHLTLSDRIEIQECLSHGMTFKAIAKRINKSARTVSREIKRHITIVTSNVTRKNKIGQEKNLPCALLLKPPFVCNPCKRRNCACSFDKNVYYAKKAQESYEALLTDAREGTPLTKESFYATDRIITEGVCKGQHIYHILKTNDIALSSSTVYRHVKKGYYSFAAVDLPRVVKFKQRKAKPLQYVPKSLKIGRNYNDFESFILENEVSSWVEMDTVIGAIGGKTILTFDFTFCNFMFGILLDDKTALSVSTKMKELKTKLQAAGKSFRNIFPVILTDNGGEFADVFAIENALDGEKETHLFFCDPAQASQKPHVEKNHTLFRDIVPKGTSFDGFSQETVNLIFSHVNSIKRKNLGGKSSYELFVFTFGEAIADLLGIEKIDANDVIQSPKLLRK